MIKYIFYCFLSVFVFLNVFAIVALIAKPIRWKKQKKKVQEQMHCSSCGSIGRFIKRNTHFTTSTNVGQKILWKIENWDTFKCDNCDIEWKIKWVKYKSDKKYRRRGYGYGYPSSDLCSKIKNDMSVYSL